MSLDGTKTARDTRRSRRARYVALGLWVIGVVLAVNAVALPSVLFGLGAALMVPAGVAILVSDRFRVDQVARSNLPAYGREAFWLVLGVALALAGLGLAALAR